MQLRLYNTLSAKKEQFIPLTKDKVGIYVCGPTVYARPHIGNARSVVVYDVLYRLLRYMHGAEAVTYVRNITDVDDKINAAAIEESITIQALTQRVTQWFHHDMEALGCMRPTIEPKATEHIDGMIAMIGRLIEYGNAYVGSDGKHVLFSVESDVCSVKSDWRYGMLSGRTLDDQQAGARVAVEGYKKHPGDFVLWKPADAQDDESSKFDSPWGVGRPGWHIECSVMSTQYLGKTFDIHGGGADLKFPHHENEIAQSCCANPGSEFARYWVHNGFLTVEGEKMSKSLGNFITVHDLLENGVSGEVIRLALLMSKYNEPLDWNSEKVEQAKKLLDKLYRRLQDGDSVQDKRDVHTSASLAASEDSSPFLEALLDDLNTPKALSYIFSNKLNGNSFNIYNALELLGIGQCSPREWFKAEGAGGTAAGGKSGDNASLTETEIEAYITARKAAKEEKNYSEADRIRDVLAAEGIILEDKPGGETLWRRA